MIDTRVDGDPESVIAAATWLRDTLAVKVGEAAEDAQSARRSARSAWEGESASSYQAFTRDLVDITDRHEVRVRRAAASLEDYAAQLALVESAMIDIRFRARGGGLVVEGTVIHPPPPVPFGPFEHGSPAEAEAQAAATRIELWNSLVTEAADAYRRFTEWVHAQMPGRVSEAQETDASDTLFGTMADLFPNFAAGAGAGIAGSALLDRSRTYRDAAREFRRRSRVAGNPAVRGQADTPAGRATLDDLLDNARRFGRFGRFVSGPGGLLIDVGFGIHEGLETGDWGRVALTTGTSIAVGAGAAALVAAGVVSAPAVVVVLVAGGVAMGASWIVGEIYDNWDGITDTVSDAWDSAGEVLGDAGDAISDAWDAVTPW